jgi:3-isopropylmalate/(R)-2-methylmalate dehydratase large subunit
MPDAPRSLFEKIWARHAIIAREDGATLLAIDRHLVHEGSRRAFELLAARRLSVRRPDRTFGVADHYAPTTTRAIAAIPDAERRAMIGALDRNAAAHGFVLHGLEDPRQGIVHVVGPEQGWSLPGLTIVCGDSHTSTHGALGALAFGIGASEVCHVLATQTLWQRKPKSFRVTIDGALAPGISAKDLALALIARIGAGGAAGHVIEYAGSAVRALAMDGRFTLCNMAIEAGARAGLIAPDDVTFAFIAGRPRAPAGALWDHAKTFWETLPSDPDAAFDRDVELDAGAVAPMVTWGTSPQDAAAITGVVPDPAAIADAARSAAARRAIDYMGLAPGQPLAGIAIDKVFIGSCTNSRLADLRSAAGVLRGRRVAAGVQAMVVPGSEPVRRAAEAEGLDRIFREAGFDWRSSGCSMCVGINGDLVPAGERCASTSNRNFVGRQGPGARTHLMSPAMAAAAAVTGRLTDVRQLMDGE